jgi:predicted metal-dependent hydrolase
MKQPFLLTDPELGDVLFHHNPRAKRYIIRIKHNQVSVTIPRGGNYKFAEKFFIENKSAIIQKTAEINAKNKSSQENTTQKPDALLRRQAQMYLPEELKRLAQEHRFSYQSLKIRKSKTRWGSCSSKKTINLSFYLMLLPQHLIEYVLLHELCHTVQMNHSPAFWALLDHHTLGRAKELRKELKIYKIEN